MVGPRTIMFLLYFKFQVNLFNINDPTRVVSLNQNNNIFLRKFYKIEKLAAMYTFDLHFSFSPILHKKKVVTRVYMHFNHIN